MLESVGRGGCGGVLGWETLAGKRGQLRRRWARQGQDSRSRVLGGYNVAVAQLEALWSSLPPELEL